MSFRSNLMTLRTGMAAGPQQKAQPTTPTNPEALHAKIGHALKKGDHGTAKKHALALVNLLHRSSSPQPGAAPDTVTASNAPSPAAP